MIELERALAIREQLGEPTVDVLGLDKGLGLSTDHLDDRCPTIRRVRPRVTGPSGSNKPTRPVTDQRVASGS
jgi:hypothetical protein